MKLNKILIVFLILINVGYNLSCSSQKVTLSPELQSIKIANGEQATTLELMETHEPVATENLTSEYSARERALQLDADIAQLILHYSGRSEPYTYRFWKSK